MDFHGLASRVASFSVEAKRKVSKKPVTVASTEYSCNVEIALTADFEGDVDKEALIKKLKAEIVAAIKAGVTTTSRELEIQATHILVKPIKTECSVVDQASIEDDEEA